MPDAATAAPTGLLTTPRHAEAPAPIPLEGVRVEAKIRDYCARVTVSQRYRNTEKKPLEAVYVFPLEEGAAVCGFEAVIGETHVVGHVKEREQAFAEYDDALAAGHGAYLLDQERPDVFTASIGNVPPGEEALVRITYVSELSREGDELRFALPTTVSPRYAPAQDQRGVGRTPAEALNPPVAWSVPYGLELEIELDMPSPIRAVESPSHPLALDVDGRRATVRLGGRLTALDCDFVLKVRLADAPAARAWMETDESGKTAALLAFEPRFETREAAGEVVFLVDRSGSMQGTSIQEARNALQLALRSLRAGCSFNIVGFGSTYESLYPESRPYDEDTLAEATRYVGQLDDSLGGTEILPALEWILERPAREALPRQLFVLTDGQVTNTEEVIALVRKHSVETRVFTFGIGAGASAHLVRGIARAGEGEAEFIHPGERIEEKVMRQLKRALSPALTGVEVDWGGLAVEPAPHCLPPVFAGGRLLAYGFLKAPQAADVVLRAKGPQGPVSFTLRLDPGTATREKLIGTLAARAMIRDLEEGRSPLHDRRGSLQDRGGRDRVKQEIVRLGVTYGLVSRETSFVAVEERKTPVQDPAVLRRVPITLTRGWGGRDDIRVAGSLAPRSPAFRGLPQPAERLAEMAFDASSYATPMQASASAPTAPRRNVLEWLRGKSHRVAGPSPVPAHPARPFDALITLQRADGTWDLTAELADILERPLRELERALPLTSGDPNHAERAWATALALAWLEARPELANEWELLADKARDWLVRCPAQPGDGTSWLEAARRMPISV
jgi:Vault protein inter-alpha-trypsin domain/von Willebrand factor type A domain